MRRDAEAPVPAAVRGEAGSSAADVLAAIPWDDPRGGADRSPLVPARRYFAAFPWEPGPAPRPGDLHRHAQDGAGAGDREVA